MLYMYYIYNICIIHILYNYIIQYVYIYIFYSHVGPCELPNSLGFESLLSIHFCYCICMYLPEISQPIMGQARKIWRGHHIQPRLLLALSQEQIVEGQQQPGWWWDPLHKPTMTRDGKNTVPPIKGIVQIVDFIGVNPLFWGKSSQSRHITRL